MKSATASHHNCPTSRSRHNGRSRPTVLLGFMMVVGACLLQPTAHAGSAKKISSCPVVISVPGTYALTKDLTCSGTAITITADNVDLNLSGHTLTGDGSGVGVEVVGPAGNSVRIHHGTVQGFNDGILLNNALNCKVSRVTAIRNLHAGIFLIFATANTLTDNITSQNGDGGIEISNSNGNIITRNDANQNFVGINVADSSFRNLVDHNSTAGNRGQGIRLLNITEQNTIQDNTCSGSEIGIAIGAYGYGGVKRNTIQGNAVTLNFRGIVVEQAFPENSENVIQGNTVLTHHDIDLEDDNPGCASNTWTGNKFATDLVAGVSDGGPDAGCIR